jgi:hypothetical protein
LEFYKALGEHKANEDTKTLSHSHADSLLIGFKNDRSAETVLTKLGSRQIKTRVQAVYTIGNRADQRDFKRTEYH